MEAWIATTNKGKIVEFKTLLETKGVEIHTASELGTYSAPPETGKTFEDNARIKAKTMKALKPGTWAMGEDSGLEVAGLNNMPGIHSARYAGDHAGDAENVAKLLKMMSLRSAQKREAQFVCCLVAYDPDGNEHVFNGLMKGEIAKKVAGTQGFGYDPIFIPQGSTKTLAQIQEDEKNEISHRAVAMRLMMEEVRKKGIVFAKP